ncbi:unnamed protein product [Ceratitis capitata]|uniref:(Mediterranean fruit fly) hypothetical protein n=1 Tax=Ceratitis capitata TaxID=7213 RepID=A0A811V8A8_CERCA|nr:unnamed protein product [Ceratitis capitata]
MSQRQCEEKDKKRILEAEVLLLLITLECGCECLCGIKDATHQINIDNQLTMLSDRMVFDDDDVDVGS